LAGVTHLLHGCPATAGEASENQEQDQGTNHGLRTLAIAAGAVKRRAGSGPAPPLEKAVAPKLHPYRISHETPR
jgi:hypothetical protein